MDLKAETLAVGQSTSNPSSAQVNHGRFFFDAGMVAATSVNLAANTPPNATTPGSPVVSGGALVVSNLSMNRIRKSLCH